MNVGRKSFQNIKILLPLFRAIYFVLHIVSKPASAVISALFFVMMTHPSLEVACSLSYGTHAGANLEENLIFAQGWGRKRAWSKKQRREEVNQ